tara:strand:+ start:314 stop:442 length:129 start_codon:yes stop_codon:yes gene_type:complete
MADLNDPANEIMINILVELFSRLMVQDYRITRCQRKSCDLSG